MEQIVAEIQNKVPTLTLEFEEITELNRAIYEGVKEAFSLGRYAQLQQIEETEDMDEIMPPMGIYLQYLIPEKVSH